MVPVKMLYVEDALGDEMIVEDDGRRSSPRVRPTAQ